MCEMIFMLTGQQAYVRNLLKQESKSRVFTYCLLVIAGSVELFEH